MEKEERRTLSTAMSYLVHPRRGSNFYARVVSALQVQQSTWIWSMAVQLIKRMYVMLWNAEWLAKSEFPYIVGVVEHEALHVILEHIPRQLKMSSSLNEEDKRIFHEIMPLAVDMAANSLLVESNPWMKKYKSETMVLPTHEPFKLPLGKSFEWYSKALMEKARKQMSFLGLLKGLLEKDGIYAETGQIHSAWRDICLRLTDEEKEATAHEIEQHTKYIVGKAVEDHMKCGSGNLPGHIQEYVNKLLEPPLISWRRLLRDKIVSTKRYRWVRSVTRMNRRHAGTGLMPFPGRNRERTFNVVFMIDTSGSMSTPELEMALNELQGLQTADPDIMITIIEADTDIHREYAVGPKDDIYPNFLGRGGTCFNRALLRAKELKPDIAFYYTDGGASAPQVESRVACPFIWLITPNGVVPDNNWGDSLKMKDRREKK